MDNKTGTGTFSISAVIQHLESLPVGESFTFLHKKSTLQDEWRTAKAVKGNGCFKITEEGKDSKEIAFDDEKESLLSSNCGNLGGFQ